MQATTKLVLTGVALALVLLITFGGCRQLLQYRAIYPGGLTIVGHADGLFGTRYHRLFLWRAPGYTDALPELTVHIGAQPYALATLTPEDFTGLGGALNEGGLYDSAGNVLQYRFEAGKLTWLSLDASRPSATRGPGGNVIEGVFSVSRGDNAVALPATREALRRAMGPPEKSTLVFAQ